MKKLLFFLIFSLLCMGCGSSTQQAVKECYASLMKAAGIEKAEFIDKSEDSLIGLEKCAWYTEQQVLDSLLANEKAEDISNLKIEILKEEQDLAEAKISYDANGKTESGRRLFRMKDGKAYWVPFNVSKVEELTTKSPIEELETILKRGTIYPTGDTLYFLRIKNNGNVGIALGWVQASRLYFKTDKGDVNPSPISHAGETLFGWQPGHIRIMPREDIWIAIPVKGPINAKSIVLDEVYFLRANGLPVDIAAPPTTLTIEID